MNKKLMQTAATLVMINAVSYVQAQGSMYIGAKAGISIPSLHGGDSDNDWNKNYTSRTGPYYGIFAEFPLNKYWSIQPELAYAAEGGKRKGIQPISIPDEYLAAFQAAFNTDKDYLYAGLNSVSKINYIQLPVMLKFNYPLSLSKGLYLFAQGGPYLGYLAYAKQFVKGDPLRVYFDADGQQEIPSSLVNSFFGSKVDTAYPAKDQLKKFNFGFQLALGVSKVLGPGKVFIEGGGNFGVIHIQKGDQHGGNNIGAATVLIGYAYNLSNTRTKEKKN